jgi:hypothetical protein
MTLKCIMALQETIPRCLEGSRIGRADSRSKAAKMLSNWVEAPSVGTAVCVQC